MGWTTSAARGRVPVGTRATVLVGRVPFTAPRADRAAGPPRMGAEVPGWSSWWRIGGFSAGRTDWPPRSTGRCRPI
ncbi:hypothetical protein CRV15_34850 (plasmid) [Streptomyces clavuligerus]|uniref:Uncharacterized protein n=1 Tax=Streptomyces clavuligerus TaxID=1901 RepID=B5GLK6_STRCL|nr:hypothetical protein SSCG_00230 [Streptomyces clavuligerus]EFG04870.1 Hypothetical protein SCLAV_p1386 [Streptomyces clavuligerus]QCS10703.1 hypothetical protein CRV15_34850 [Streptomyces clavuligerus]QPJ97261.1 hypothetical protein GE265_29625 [Streptomyces clavuligerus]